jgi:hypothetical protein
MKLVRKTETSQKVSVIASKFSGRKKLPKETLHKNAKN